MLGGLSHRRRRRLRLVLALAVLAGGVAAAAVLLPKGNRLADTVPEPSSPVAAVAAPAPTPAPARERVSVSDRRALEETIALFVSTSVARHHPERSWPIVAPVLREGMSRKQWSTGSIPVVPYPARRVDLVRLESLAGRSAQLEVVLEAPPAAHLVRKTFQIELHRLPRALHGWTVSSWVPEGVSTSQLQQDTRPASSAEIKEVTHPAHLALHWIIVPLALLGGGVIAVPLIVLGRDSLAGKRARRAASRRADARYDPRA